MKKSVSFGAIHTLSTNSISTEVIQINVGGEILSTTIETLRLIPRFFNMAPPSQTRDALFGAMKSNDNNPFAVKVGGGTGVGNNKSDNNNNIFAVNSGNMFGMKADAPFAAATSTTTGMNSMIRAEIDMPGSSNSMNRFLPSVDLLQNEPRDENGRLFIDRDPELFKIILNYVRSRGNEAYLRLDRHTLRKLLVEAEYFGWYPTSNYNINLFESCLKLLKEISNDPRSSIASSPSIQLIKMKVFNKNSAIANFKPSPATGNPTTQKFQPIPHTDIEFELNDNAPVLVTWYFGDCAGEFAVLLDGQVLSTQPALCGVFLDNAQDRQFDYATNAFIKHVCSCSKGKHHVQLLWKSYRNCSYQLQGPVISEVYQLNPNACNIVDE
jgi:hypothetical protein